MDCVGLQSGCMRHRIQGCPSLSPPSTSTAARRRCSLAHASTDTPCASAVYMHGQQQPYSYDAHSYHAWSMQGAFRVCAPCEYGERMVYAWCTHGRRVHARACDGSLPRSCHSNIVSLSTSPRPRLHVRVRVRPHFPYPCPCVVDRPYAHAVCGPAPPYYADAVYGPAHPMENDSRNASPPMCTATSGCGGCGDIATCV